MTEKRFILVEYVNKGLFIQDNANDETQYFQGSKASLEKVVNLLNNLNDENEQLKKELSEYKDFVLSDDKILCYTCLFCTHKGIYEVDCDIKGHVDVHGSCLSYTKKEVKE